MKTMKAYLLTAEGITTATLTQGDSSYTWKILPEGGQTVVIVPAGAVLSLSNPAADLKKIPFDHALGLLMATGGGGRIVTSNNSAWGERILAPCGEENIAPQVDMQHGIWVELPMGAASCRVTPAGTTDRALQMQLVYTPTTTMSTEEVAAWLVGATWLYGAPMMGAGIRYIITLVQAFGEIKANATAWGGASA